MTDPEEEAEYADLDEEEAERHGEEVAGSYLRRYLCTVCGDRHTLAVPSHAAVAMCSDCRIAATGYGAPDGSVPYGPIVGYPRGTYVPAVVERLPHPAPVTTSRQQRPEGVVEPGPVQKLATRARESGWQVLVQYADGHGIHGTTGRPTARVQSFAVRMQHASGRRAVAVYRSGSTWTWSSVWIFGDRAPFGHAGVTELEEYLQRGGAVEEQWFAAVVEKREAAEERKKVKAACDRGSHARTSTVEKVTTCLLCDNSWDWKAAPWRKPKKSKEGAS